MNEKKTAERGYHHGDLRDALIRAADELLTERGLEGFTLRETARRAGVSPAAPSHHFGGTAGLLTEVAALGWAELARRLAIAGDTGSTAERLKAQGVAYVRFAVEFPGRFHLMFRHDMLLRDQPSLDRATGEAWNALERTVRALRGQKEGEELDAEGEAMLIGIWSTAHGFAHLTLDKKLSRMAECGSDTDMLDTLFPSIIDTLWVKRLG
ncbi:MULTISPECIES: TetR/AcrR family transcriptional regulator [unclassified Shinella]|uniref:TetR/AcrR family transcriptional regulator n=1 Tax=unclassified Shinella TaxID=2643062 RepID=UPI00225D1569|nr:MULTISPECIES: TetR/AcrR family transcriptional regulator [unclassified Shinella]MCO5139926.1 TetR/AcrR family transcriptional regulator [Shinella sp.]MDC7257059.1 TetR/AcrR family transcriptional regulator [Shinella sp. YE25]CAI0339923.1 TetR/AcrR family transcriptional regulator [Rhizobiaceae bacterium]CAK7258314.1 TetR/AcrR family transcriptional regulator [Shinella sp. WSC3-e]